MIGRISYYILIIPISLLPLRFIYLLTDFFYLLLLSILPYRKKLIKKNIRNSFKSVTEKDVNKLTRKFYKHLSDILAESIKNLTISKKDLLKRVHVVNPALMEDLYKKDKSVLIISGHFNNWEWIITSQNFLFDHCAVGIGMPLTNKFWDKKINARRARNGMKILNASNVDSFFGQSFEKPIATLILADQAPANSFKSYWMNFLNQETAIVFGPEQIANKYNQACVFLRMNKIKRGYYQIELELITDNPHSLNWGELTEKHARLLEEMIIKNPEQWIWSHNRWKREIPSDIETLKKTQKSKFESKFRR